MDRIAESTQSRIDEFCKTYEWACYGPGHIVFDDQNLMDGHIQFCIDECDRWIREGLIDELHTIEEIKATKEFLRELLSIPEEDR